MVIDLAVGVVSPHSAEVFFIYLASKRSLLGQGAG